MKKQLILRLGLHFVFAILSFTSIHAQWEFLGSPENGHPLGFDAEGDTILALTTAGLYFSDDQAASWQSIQTPDNEFMFGAIQIEKGTLYLTVYNPVIFQDNSIWKSNVYRSDDWGSSWHLITGSIDPTNGLNVLIIQQDTVYYLSYGSILVSFDKGENYSIELPNAGTNTSYFMHEYVLHALTRHTSGNSLVWSENYGASWDTLYTSPAQNKINHISSIDGVLWKTESKEPEYNVYISLSSDGGATWMTTDTLSVPYPRNAKVIGHPANLLLVDATEQTATIYHSADNGLTWLEKQIEKIVTNPLYTNGTLVMATYGGIFVSHDHGNTLRKSSTGLQAATVIGFAHSGSSLWANANFTMYNHDNINQQWPEVIGMHDIESTLDGHLIGALNGIPYRSEDGGQTWVVIPPDDFGPSAYNNISALEAAGDMMYIIGGVEGFYSDDYGVSWNQLPDIWPSGSFTDITFNDGKYFTAGFWGNIEISVNGFDFNEHFAEIPLSLLWETDMVYYHEPYIFVASDTFLIRIHKDSSHIEVVPSPASGSIYPVSNFKSLYSLQSHGNILIAAYYGHGVYVSYNYGDTWYALNDGLDNLLTYKLYTINTDLFMGVDGGVWRRPLAELAPYHYQGNAFHDPNANGLQDPGEILLPDIPIHKKNQGSLTYTLTDGSFLLLSPDMDQDTIEGLPPSPYAEITTAPVPVTGSVDSLSFGVHYTPGIHDASIVLSNESPLRPGFETNLYVHYRNRGTETATMEIKLWMDSALEYIASDLPPSFNGDTLEWVVEDVAPGEHGRIIISVRLDDTTPIGAIIELMSMISIQHHDDYNPEDNVDSLSLIVVGAYDPNDKAVFPSGYITPAMIADTQRLEYTIRFQNTGNYPATFVRIQDTLSAHLDLTSLEILAASHAYTWKLLPHHVLDFFFDNINLPDSTIDERGSHGFVKFAVNAKPTLQLADKIENQAYIYFDFNVPVITNTVGSTVGFETGIKEPGKNLLLTASPLPSKDFISVTIRESGTVGEVILSLYDAKGALVKTKTSISPENIQMDIRDVPSGIYYLHARIGRDQGTIRILKN